MIGVNRVEAERLLRSGERVVVAIQRVQHVAVDVVQRGLVGREAHGFTHSRQRRLAFALLEPAERKDCQRLRIVGLLREREHRLGFGVGRARLREQQPGTLKMSAHA